MDEKEYSVSEAVRLIGVESHVLRYWEEELAVEIKRSSQGHRIYSKENIETFRQVKALKEKGIQLKAIRVLLAEQKHGIRPQEDMELLRQVVEAAGLKDGRKPGETGEKARRELGETGEEESRNVREQDLEEPDADIYEIVEIEKQPDHLQQFEQILKRMLEEVVAEQNEKLEKAITEVIREEIDDLYVQYDQMMCEAAAAMTEKRKKRKGKLAQLLERLL